MDVYVHGIAKNILVRVYNVTILLIYLLKEDLLVKTNYVFVNYSFLRISNLR